MTRKDYQPMADEFGLYLKSIQRRRFITDGEKEIAEIAFWAAVEITESALKRNNRAFDRDRFREWIRAVRDGEKSPA